MWPCWFICFARLYMWLFVGLFFILFLFLFCSLLFCLENWTNGNKPVPYTNVIAIIIVIINRWHLVDVTTQAQKAHYPSEKKRSFENRHFACSVVVAVIVFFSSFFRSHNVRLILSSAITFLMKNEKKKQWHLINNSCWNCSHKKKLTETFLKKTFFFSLRWNKSTFGFRFFFSSATVRMQDYRKAIKKIRYLQKSSTNGVDDQWSEALKLWRWLIQSTIHFSPFNYWQKCHLWVENAKLKWNNICINILFYVLSFIWTMFFSPFICFLFLRISLNI